MKEALNKKKIKEEEKIVHGWALEGNLLSKAAGPISIFLNKEPTIHRAFEMIGIKIVPVEIHYPSLPYKNKK